MFFGSEGDQRSRFLPHSHYGRDDTTRPFSSIPASLCQNSLVMHTTDSARQYIANTGWAWVDCASFMSVDYFCPEMMTLTGFLASTYPPSQLPAISYFYKWHRRPSYVILFDAVMNLLRAHPASHHSRLLFTLAVIVAAPISPRLRCRHLHLHHHPPLSHPAA